MSASSNFSSQVLSRTPSPGAGEKRRILFLSRGGRTGGSQQQLFYLVANLDPGHYEPIVVCREDGPVVDALVGQGVETHVIPLRPWRTWPAAFLRRLDVRRLTRLARERRASLVHSSDLWLSGYMLAVARRRSVPSVLHVRTPLSPESIRKHGCGRATAVIAISHRVKRDLLRAGIPAEKITVVYDAVNLELYRPQLAGENVLRRDFPGADGVLVGIVGRVVSDKHQLTFLRAAARAARAITGGAMFFVIGEAHEADYERRARRFVAENGLDGRVIFTGRRSDMPELLASLDVLVTLSGGSVMIEAMACGTPVISAGFTKPGESTIVQDGRTGLLVPSRDEAELAAALVCMGRDRGLRRQMGLAARRHAEARFDHTGLVAATRQVYDRLLNDRSS